MQSLQSRYPSAIQNSHHGSRYDKEANQTDR